MHKRETVIVWFRQDLRVKDNPALWHAAQSEASIVPVFIYDDEKENPWYYGGAQKVALYEALQDLTEELRKFDVKLILRRGNPKKILEEIIRETGATSIYWNRRYEEWAVTQDIDIKENIGAPVESFNGKLLLEPWEIKTGQKTPYKVFTPYWRAVQEILAKKHPSPLPVLRKLYGYTGHVKSDILKDWDLLPVKPDWSKSILQRWDFTESAAHKVLDEFIDDKVARYPQERDFPNMDATSRLSPYLALGKISPRQIWHEITMAMHDGRIKPVHHEESEKFLRQIAWREFSYHLLFHFPHTAAKALYEKFNAFPWRRSEKDLEAWQKGQTGYPLVDAGMRQLWQMGWMHNRVRLVVASFLIKHLLLPWQEGAKWFWDTLVDADLANNTMGWQWTAGSGADAAPYFRIFNPITQGEKFKAQDYIREFVPELAALPDRYIHAPFDAPKEILDNAGVILGKTYPGPLVEHKPARERALEALKKIS